MSFGEHLRSDEHIDLAALKTAINVSSKDLRREVVSRSMRAIFKSENFRRKISSICSVPSPIKYKNLLSHCGHLCGVRSR
ncbi:MAG: hypothetical protein WKG07_40775 [Hymenobacter sp.]